MAILAVCLLLTGVLMAAEPPTIRFTGTNEPAAQSGRINLRNCDDVVFRNVTIQGLKEGVDAIQTRDSTDVKIEGLTSGSKAAAESPGPVAPARDAVAMEAKK